MFKRSKYGAKKTIKDGIKFDSKIESEYYDYLLGLQKTGEVKAIRLQPKFELNPKFEKLGKKYRPIYYVGDFEVELYNYVNDSSTTIIVDIKGLPSEGAKLKRKMFDYKYPDIELQWIVRYKGGWVQYEDNKKRIKENKKLKKK